MLGREADERATKSREVDLPQVDLMNFRVEYVRPRSGRASDHKTKDFSESLPKPLTTSYGINSFGYLAAISWNSLPDHYRTISDFTSFRQLISSRNK